MESKQIQECSVKKYRKIIYSDDEVSDENDEDYKPASKKNSSRIAYFPSSGDVRF